MFPDAGDDEDAWVEYRLERRRQTDSDTFELKQGTGRWLQINARRMQDGGIVSVYTNITALKEREEELASVHKDALQAQTQLQEAIEAVSEGFVVFDKHKRLVICNSTYRNFYADAASQDVADMVVPGAYQLDILAAAFDAGMFPNFEGSKEDNIAQWHMRQTKPRRAVELRFRSGVWVQINERPTHDGGYAAVYTDITAMKRREEELSNAHDAAMEATRTKSQFLANLSHELRTSLNAVIGITEMLEEDARDDELDDYVEPLQRVTRAGKHLLHLINEVLDLSKIEAGRLEFHIEDIDLETLAGDLGGVLN